MNIEEAKKLLGDLVILEVSQSHDQLIGKVVYVFERHELGSSSGSIRLTNVSGFCREAPSRDFELKDIIRCRVLEEKHVPS